MKHGPWRVLRHRQFAIVWTADAVSNVGTWMQRAVLGVYVATATGQAAWTALVGTAGLLAVGLLQPLGGTVADRHDRRHVVMTSALLQAATAALLVVLFMTHHTEPLLLVALGFVDGLFWAFTGPAFTAITPDLIPRDDVPDAAFLEMLSWNLGRTIGPMLAGLLIAIGSYEIALIINAVSFVLVSGSMLFVHPQRTTHDESGGAWTRIVTGSRAVMSEPGCRWAILLATATVLLIAPFVSLIPVVNQTVLHGPPQQAAFLLAAQGVGSIVCLIAAGALVRAIGQAQVFGLALLALPVLAISYVLSSSVVMAAVFVGLLGGAYATTLASGIATVQLRAAPQWRGRALALFWALPNLALAIAAPAQGAIADRIGIRGVTISTAFVLLGAVLLTRRASTDAWRAPLPVEAERPALVPQA